MKAFRQHLGVVAPLVRNNIDTDAIIPSREMKRVSRDGLGEGLFAGWRYRAPDDRTPDPAFVLNRPEYAQASILATGPNFGCGSSREHAVWALAEHGFRAVLAPSFGAIFERNCYNNGVLPIVLTADVIQALLDWTTGDPAHRPLNIDLTTKTLQAGDDWSATFDVPTLQQEMLINGWDPIDLTLQHTETITAFEERDRGARPWAYGVGPQNSRSS